MKIIITEEQSEKFNHKIKSMVNKYGLNHAIELFNGKDVIKRAYQDNPLEFLGQFENLTPIEEGKKTYYINEKGIPLFSYFTNKQMENVFVNKDIIWFFFKKVLGLRSMVIQEIISDWLIKNYNIDLSPIEWDFSFYGELGYH